MKILLLGANGQLGWMLKGSLAPLGELKACTEDDIDFENEEALRLLIKNYRPNVIVNAAAYTNVDKAESEPEKAFNVNAKAVGVIAKEAQLLDAWVIHYSTDYVFDGEKSEPYTEMDQPNPINVYGETKLKGEQELKKHCDKYIVFRVSWLYSVLGKNFLNSILKLALERSELKIVSDQVGTPTSVDFIANITALIVNKIKPIINVKDIVGTYNLAPSGETSWFDFTKLIVKTARLKGVFLQCDEQTIYSIATIDYPTPAKRPKNSRLNSQKIKNVFGFAMPDWKIDVERTIAILSKEVSV